MPTYNEIESIADEIVRVRKLGYDVIVTDGGSTDGTVELARQLGVIVLNRTGKGKGFGVQQAIDHAHTNQYDVIGFIDCDMTYPMEDFPQLISHLPQNDLVVGTRPMKKIAPVRRLVNIFYVVVTSILYGHRIHDLISGMRVFMVEKYHSKLTSTGFEPETETTCLALKNNWKYKEVPIDYLSRRGDSKIGVKDFFTNFWYIIKVRFSLP